MATSTKILLLSSSRVGERAFLEHGLEAIDAVLGGMRDLVFVPYALADWSNYTSNVAHSLRPLGITVVGLHTVRDPLRALQEAQAVFVGGGNTFRLLSALERADALLLLQERAGRDLVYIGSSAGTNLACPTIRTTNDMPIVEPTSFASLNLVPFQINPHFVSGNPFPGHRGETREERIAQFHEVSQTPVVGLPERCWLEVDRGERATRAVLGGSDSAVLFRRGVAARALTPGAVLTASSTDGEIELT